MSFGMSHERLGTGFVSRTYRGGAGPAGVSIMLTPGKAWKVKKVLAPPAHSA
jgi:hypothetical protein